MPKITQDDMLFVNTLEDLICKHFSVKKQDVINKTGKRDASIARGYLFYILHYRYNISTSKIATIYVRSDRGVKKTISKFKFLITKQKFFKDMYNNIELEKIDALFFQLVFAK